MAVTFRQLCEPVEPVQPTVRFAAVLARFTSETDLDILPVVFGRTLVGTLTRRAVFDLAGSDIPREHLCDARITPLLDEMPATADGGLRIGGYAARSARGDGKALADGVVVLEAGAYAGIVRPRALARALAEENARRAMAQKEVAEKVTAFKARHAREAAERAKLQALLAHELRTPLNAAQASADMLGQHIRSSDGKLLARTVSQACRALDRLLDDLMMMSRADLGNLPVSPEPVSLKRLAGDLEALWRPRCAEKGLAFRLGIGRLAAERVELDPVRLRQVLDNLVSNAIKFTTDGEVRVDFGLASEDETLLLSVEISDTGPGLSGEDLQRVFRPFARTDSAGQVDGSGLGLTVTKAVMDSLGGQIAYRSGAGGGSVFSLLLPVQKAGPRIVSENRRASAMHRFEVGDVLLVDDHEPSRVVLAKALKAAGWRVDGVDTLAQALRRVAHKPYQAVLCDLHLADGDGTEILRAIRRGEGHDPAAPVVAVTADRSDARLEACRAVGFDAIWPKPIKPNEAVMALADIIIAAAHRAASGDAAGQRRSIA